MHTDSFRGLDSRGARLLDRAMLSDLELRLRQPSTKRTVSDAEVWLKPQDWQRLVDLVGQASAIVHERGQAAQTRGAKHISATTLLLEFQKWRLGTPRSITRARASSATVPSFGSVSPRRSARLARGSSRSRSRSGSA
jgi:hypothetical protein